jgi:hypothetical protein
LGPGCVSVDRIGLDRDVKTVEEERQPLVGAGTSAPANAAVKQPDLQGDRTLSCRYELKYLISASQVVAIEEFVKPYMDLDRYSKLQPNGYYPIVSLYLDSNDLQLCSETLTAKQNRFKLRIRGYSDDQQYPLFFEIKRRVNTVIVKARAKVKHGDLAAAMRGRRVHIATDQQSLDQFQLYVATLGARPMALIRYLRKAYEAESENRVRVTFDRDLCYKVTEEPKVYLSGAGWCHNYVTMEGIVLEIKFTGHFPKWLCGMVRYLDLQAQGISKYATSMQQACALGFCAPRGGY